MILRRGRKNKDKGSQTMPVLRKWAEQNKRATARGAGHGQAYINFHLLVETIIHDQTVG